MASLDEILTDKQDPEPIQSETPPETTVSIRNEHTKKEMEAQGRDPETGRFVAKEEPKEEPKVEAKPEPKAEEKPTPPKQEYSEKERAFLQAAQEERRKRQELEKRLKELEAASKPKEPEKPFWDDPEGVTNTKIEQTRRELEQQLLSTRLGTSEMITRAKYQDFDEKLQVFTELAQGNPWLAQEMMKSVNPAEYAYTQAKNHMLLKQAGSIEQMRADIEKQVRAQVEAELKAKEAELQAKKAALPPTLSDARGTTQNRPVWSGPTSMDTILGRN